MKKKLITMLLSLAITSAVLPVTVNAEDVADKGIVILHTNDIHCGIDTTDDTFGYAELAAYRAKLESEGYTTILVDAGDYSQGDVVGTLSDGEYIIDIMNELEYDVATIGNHEFDYGMDRFYELVDMAEFEIISSNFVSLETGLPVVKANTIIEADGTKIGFVGISTPETFTKSTPTYFQNDKGEYIYSFCADESGEQLYSAVQKAVDDVVAQGAEKVIAIGHLGIDLSSGPWTSHEVIRNTHGIDMFIDGHSHSIIEGEKVADENGDEVLLSSTGTKMNNIGAITINNGELSADLVSKSDYSVTDNTSCDEYKAYVSATEFIDEIKSEFNELIETVIARADVSLVANDPEKPEVRLIRNTETNLGDFCADAYRTVLGADVGVVNGGGIRANIEKGDITYGKIISVHPFGNEACLVEATGQDILDMLELSVKDYPYENGSFLQVSGVTYELHSYIPSSVVLDKNESFVKVDGEYRVKNVAINGEPLDLSKTYTLASHNYMLKNGGGGFSMFNDNKILLDCVMLDNRVLIDYMTEKLGGVVTEEYSNPYGSGRITVVSEKPSSDTTDNTANPETGDAGNMLAVYTMFAVSAGALLICTKRRSN